MAIIDGYPATSFDAKDRAWVKAVADEAAQGASGDVLPAVTTADDGSSLGVINGEWGVMPNPMGKIAYIELLETDDGYETSETVAELWEKWQNNDFVYVWGLGVPVLGLLEISETSPVGTYFAIINVPPFVYRDNNEIKLLAYSYMADPAIGSEKFLFTYDSEIEGDFLPSTN